MEIKEKVIELLEVLGVGVSILYQICRVIFHTITLALISIVYRVRMWYYNKK